MYTMIVFLYVMYRASAVARDNKSDEKRNIFTHTPTVIYPIVV